MHWYRKKQWLIFLHYFLECVKWLVRGENALWAGENCVQFAVSILIYFFEDIPNVWLCEVLVFFLQYTSSMLSCGCCHAHLIRLCEVLVFFLQYASSMLSCCCCHTRLMFQSAIVPIYSSFWNFVVLIVLVFRLIQL